MDHSGRNPGSERTGGGCVMGAPLRATYTRGDYRKKEECQCRKLEEAMWGPASLAGGRW